MQTTWKFELVSGKQKMISLTIGISEELQLQVTGMQNDLRSGEIALHFITGNTSIIIYADDMRATAQAFTHLADMLDAEETND